MNKRVSRSGIDDIAEAFNNLRNRQYSAPMLFDLMVGAVADMLEAENDMFDRDRFLDGVYREVGKKG